MFYKNLYPQGMLDSLVPCFFIVITIFRYSDIFCDVHHVFLAVFFDFVIPTLQLWLLLLFLYCLNVSDDRFYFQSLWFVGTLFDARFYFHSLRFKANHKGLALRF